MSLLSAGQVCVSWQYEATCCLMVSSCRRLKSVPNDGKLHIPGMVFKD